MIRTDITPPPQGCVLVKRLRSVNPYLCPISGVRVHGTEAGIGACESLYRLSLYDVEAVFHLRFSLFCKK
jgi:hypothetical protein